MSSPDATPPRELSDEEFLSLSPSDRQDYLMARAEAGVDNTGFIGLLQRAVARSGADARADQVGQERVQELSSSGIERQEGLNPSNADYQGHDHASLTRYVTEDLEPAQVTEASDAYHKLHLAFEEFSKELSSAVSRSRNEWEGDAANSAHGYFSSLTTWADGNSQNAQLASEVMFQQAEAGSTVKNRMPEEIPFNWETEMKKWGSNPLDIVDNINNTMETHRASQEAHAQAASVMTQYDNDLYTAASKQPVFAEPPKFGEGDGRAGIVGGPMPGPAAPAGNGGTDASGYVGGGVPGGSVPGGGGSGSIPGGVGSVPGGGGSVPGGGGSGGVAPVPTPLPAGRGTGSGSLPGDSGTRPSGYRPPTTGVPRGSSPGGQGPMGMGAMPMGGMAAAGGAGGGSGGDYSSKMGRGMGGFGPGGSAGAGGAGTPGAGTGSGAAKPGGVGGVGPGAAGGAGAAAAAGRGGMGAGMGGAGRGGAQGGGDEEHQRPTYLVEGDPDEVFGTDQRTAPPVIGE
ncbi:hypothetical protein [Qaidamihabitans albus]|uniref:hypothetical protein n=1 Tax=Qaidamihabitans albus TaxID=2795733 RepID=UPI0018F1C9A3|nr:hypothetical protein [Qaidamihabitans albus]